MGAKLQQGLQALQAKHACIIDVRGMGLLWAIEFSTDMAAAVVAACNEAGLLLNVVRPHAIRFMPPLTVTQAEIDEAIAKLCPVLERQMVLAPTAS
jgi:4-aminobutyrate aminotransferase-like enzyme